MLHALRASFDNPAKSASEALAKDFAALAEKIGASDFHLYRIRRRERSLNAVMDGSFPVLSERTHSLAAALSPRIAELASTSMCILWWGEDDSQLREMFRKAEWTTRITARLAPPGVALPLVDSTGHQGLIVFAGSRLSVDENELMEIHAHCLRLFEAIEDVLPEPKQTSLPSISPRELQCLELTARGLTSEEIARDLALSVHTANQYLANAAEKLNAANRVHAVAKALRVGLID